VSRYARLTERLADVDDKGLRRTLRPLVMTGPVTARYRGEPVTVFSSNDYLGLAQHPELRAAWKGGGAGSSRLIAGDRPAHHALEEALSEKFGRPATLFNTGYTANLAVLSVLVGPGDTVASDALNHASIIDGVRLSGAEKVIVPHGRPAPACTLAVVEGLYSMDGDALALEEHVGDHWLLVDEAHAVGAVGPQGRGEAARQGIAPDFLVGTLGKAYGAFGAFVVGPPELRELFVSRGRTFVYTTGLPESVAAAALVGLRLADDERRERLADRTKRFRRGLTQTGLVAGGSAHIVPIVLGERTMAVADELLARGVFALGIRPPTVAPGTERIRLSLSSEHTDEQIDRLLDILSRLSGTR
jgi:7-keto-8-aminopelargonate synthetase-like enzyme